MKKIIVLFLVTLFCMTTAQAKSTKANFNGIIKEFGANKNNIAVSIVNEKSGKTVYSLNDKTLMNPASVQKIITMPAAAQTLGKDYSFKTKMWEILKSMKDKHSIVFTTNKTFR